MGNYERQVEIMANHWEKEESTSVVYSQENDFPLFFIMGT
jgi:hypothetical protein